MKLFSYFRVVVAACVLSACGGGGGDAGAPPFEPDPGSGGGTVTASDLTLVLSAPTLENTGTQTLTATATAVDENRNALPGISVVLSVDSNATAVVSGSQTDNQGVVTGVIGIGGDKSNRIITVIARSGSLEKTASFAVIGADLRATVKPEFTPSESASVNYALVDSNSAAMPDTLISFTAPGGIVSEGRTDINGQIDFSFTAPSAAGPFQISATAAGFTLINDLNVRAGATAIPNAVGTVESASVIASPNVVTVNTDATLNRAEVRALFVGASNKPIKNIRARFDDDGDINSINGTVSSGTSFVYSDDSGIARTNYFPGSRSSPTDGVTIRVCWDYKDFATTACPNAVRTTLTVVSEPLSVSIGTNGLLEEGTNQLTYIQRFAVQVVDAAGQAKADVLITPELDLLRYFKGEWVSTSEGWGQVAVAACENEDIDRDGLSDVYSNGAVEDANGSFNLTPGRPALEPRKADVAVSFDGPKQTDSSGKVVIKIEYPKDVGSWVYYNLVVGASGIGGTEGRANFADVLNVLASDADDPDVEPPFRFSPYGTQSGDPILVTIPDGRSAQLCTNPN